MTDSLERYRQATALRWGCDAGLFTREGNHFLSTQEDFFEILTFGAGTVIRAREPLCSILKQRYGELSSLRLPEESTVGEIGALLREYGRALSGSSVRYLMLKEPAPLPAPQGFRYQLWEGQDVASLFTRPCFHNALGYNNHDVLAYGAFDGQELVALAGCDDREGDFWQIGIDTLPAYRGRGLARYLTQYLALEIRKRGKEPFYTTWPANVASSRTAVAAGFTPVWFCLHSVSLNLK